MSDIVAFIEARLAEDGAVARAAAELPVCAAAGWGPADRWSHRPRGEGRAIHLLTPGYAESIDSGVDLICAEDGGILPSVADHIVTWDPARVLREVEAKRAIIAAHTPLLETVEWPDDQTGKGEALVCAGCGNRDIDAWIGWRPALGEAGTFPDGVKPPYIVAPCNTLKHLAAVYADHPDFDPAWGAEVADGR